MLWMTHMRDMRHTQPMRDMCAIQPTSHIAHAGNELEFLLRVPGQGDYSFLADTALERNDWMCGPPPSPSCCSSLCVDDGNSTVSLMAIQLILS